VRTKLLGDALGDELSVGLGVERLDNVDDDDLAGHRERFFTETVKTGSLATDGNTGTSDVNVDRDAVTRATNDHVRNAGAVQFVLEEALRSVMSSAT
jgi:hypothetical protein